MPRNTSIPHWEHFVDLVDTRIEALRTVLIEGEDSGPATPFDFEAFIERKTGRPGQ